MHTDDLVKLALVVTAAMCVLIALIRLCFFRRRRIVYDLVDMSRRHQDPYAGQELRNLNYQFMCEMGRREAFVFTPCPHSLK